MSVSKTSKNKKGTQQQQTIRGKQKNKSVMGKLGEEL